MRRSVLGVIPARGGSKGIPHKNIVLLNGQPLLAYTIQAARRSRWLDRVVVSTDSPAIAAMARRYRAEVIMRPAALATASAPTEPTLLHAIETLRTQDGYRPSAVATLEPTSPLRSAGLIDRCIQAVFRDGIDAVLAVAPTSSLVGTIVRGGRFAYLITGQPRRRQDRQMLYKECSAVYVTKTSTLMRTHSVLGTRLAAVIADATEAIDINEPLDLVIAEAVMRWRKQGRRT